VTWTYAGLADVRTDPATGRAEVLARFASDAGDEFVQSLNFPAIPEADAVEAVVARLLADLNAPPPVAGESALERVAADLAAANAAMAVENQSLRDLAGRATDLVKRSL